MKNCPSANLLSEKNTQYCKSSSEQFAWNDFWHPFANTSLIQTYGRTLKQKATALSDDSNYNYISRNSFLGSHSNSYQISSTDNEQVWFWEGVVNPSQVAKLTGYIICCFTPTLTLFRVWFIRISGSHNYFFSIWFPRNILLFHTPFIMNVRVQLA